MMFKESIENALFSFLWGSQLIGLTLVKWMSYKKMSILVHSQQDTDFKSHYYWLFFFFTDDIFPDLICASGKSVDLFTQPI